MLVTAIRLGQGGFILTAPPAADDKPPGKRLITLTAATHPRKCR